MIETSGDLRYTSVSQLADALGVRGKIPAWEPGTSPTFENVGTGDNSEDTFYLDQRNIIDASLVLSFGASQSSTTPLVLTTDYTLELSTGKITLTAAGVTAVGTNIIFAESYEYISNNMTNELLDETLARSEQQVDDVLNTTFTDGTVSNPTYPLIEDEKHSSQSGYDNWAYGGVIGNNVYSSDERPVKDIESTLPGDIDDTTTTISFATGDGVKFPISGKILIGSEIISYTGLSTDALTGVARGVDGSTAATHVTGDGIHTTIVKVSETIAGTTAEFVVASWGDQVTVSELGKVYIYQETLVDNIPQDIADRLRLTYYHGFDIVPRDITRLTLVFAKRQLAADNVTKAMVAGRDEFKPEMFNVDLAEIESIINAYRQNAMGNT